MDEIGVACGAYMEQINASWVWLRCLKEGDSVENLGVDKRIIFKQI
jgi:hypothetical protein